MTVKEALAHGRAFLSGCDIETAALDAALLLMRAGGFSRTELATKQENLLSDAERYVYEAMLAERAVYKPIQYIMNTCEFMSLDFFVDERVLIPRPDTEILAEAAIQAARELRRTARILELGTGSGCLAAAIAKYAENAVITATDISAEALEVAAYNAEKHSVTGRISFLQGDLFSALSGETNHSYDIIISNPPYIIDGGILPKQVSYEPESALYGGADGLYLLKRIIKGAGAYFSNGAGRLFLEMGWDQWPAVKELLRSAGYKDAYVLKDLGGHDTVASAYKLI